MLEGSVVVQPEGRPAIDLSAPAWFGEIALLRGEPRTADVVGGPQGARLLRMSRVSVLPALERNPRLRHELAKVSDARREAAGVVDDEPQRLGFGQRVAQLLRDTLREMRPW
jgi:CRP-like cAMP-binding protein